MQPWMLTSRGDRAALRFTAIVAVVSVATSCATVPKRNPLPEALVIEAQVPGIPEARNWADEPPPWFEASLAESRRETRAKYPGVFRKRHAYLALSGGGANGAFGAGLLVGWTEAGDRPEFTMVTGISTGALIAPFAFLGSDYDHVLTQVATTLTEDQLIKRRGKIKTLRTDAAASTDPLKALIAKYVDEDVVAAIAEEHKKGRRLNIGTTNLDSMRPVSWRVSAIAASGQPDSLALIRQIILASASIPAAFPPVLFEVEADGNKYDELHVDGGAASQVYLYPIGIDWDEVLEELEVPGKPKVYVIRNSRIDPQWQAVDNKLFSIAGRSVESLVRTQGIGDLYRLYIETVRDGLEFNLAYIPTMFDIKPTKTFDTKYMKALYQMAYELAKSGYPWKHVPPGMEEAPLEE